MELRDTKPTEVVVGYQCDICCQNCCKLGEAPVEAAEYATLSADWGYWSQDKDLTWHECHMCESCFDKVKEFIQNELKGTVRTGPVEQRPIVATRKKDLR